MVSEYDTGSAPASVQPVARIRSAVMDALENFRLHNWHDADGELLPLVDRLCREGARDISSGQDELNMLGDAIMEDVESALGVIDPTPAERVLPRLSEPAVLHAVTMAQTDAHKQGDKAFWLALAERLRLQWNAMGAAPAPQAAAAEEQKGQP